MSVRVRVGPSLKRPLSVGALRLALFNYAFAEANSGAFIIRIEDTDRTRLDARLLDDLYAMLDWTGIQYHEGGEKGGNHGPYIQSERASVYRAHAHRLVKAGRAYFCFCSAKQLEEIRAKERTAHRPSRYDGRCFRLSPEQSWKRVDGGEKHVVRMRVPRENHDSDLAVHDALRGTINIRLSTLDDQILIKSDGMPTYHFSSVVDDHLMDITHVIRADVWLVNTPKHLLLYEWFGWDPPQFVHVPPLSGGIYGTAVRHLKDAGFLPDAVVNFAGMMGWRQHADQELFSLRDMTTSFRLDQLRPSCGGADPARLRWLGAQHIRRRPVSQLAEDVRPFLDTTAVPDSSTKSRQRAARLLRHHAATLEDLADQFSRAYLPARPTPEDLLQVKPHNEALLSVVTALGSLDDATDAGIRHTIESFCRDHGVPLGSLLRALRFALFSSQSNPDIYAMIELIGVEEAARRVADVSRLLAEQSPCGTREDDHV
ncbi:glutamate--tRNA ligase [Streptomyces sp. NPDC059785]|uniref:glutamate--tRNA ligase n=1 Tax=unclassified Streptomyces TaxID=2593676 RepID=UPI003648A4B0